MLKQFCPGGEHLKVKKRVYVREMGIHLHSVVIPGTAEDGTPEHRNTTEHSETPRKTRNSATKPGTPFRRPGISQNNFQKTRNTSEHLSENPEHLSETRNTFQKTRNTPEQLPENPEHLSENPEHLIENPKHLTENQKQARKDLKNALNALKKKKSRNTAPHLPPPKKKKMRQRFIATTFP